MSVFRIEFSVVRGDSDVGLIAECKMSPYVPAQTYGPPETWSPEEGGDVRINDITLHGKLWDGELTKDEADHLEELCAEAAGAAMADAYDDYDDRDELEFAVAS